MTFFLKNCIRLGMRRKADLESDSSCGYWRTCRHNSTKRNGWFSEKPVARAGEIASMLVCLVAFMALGGCAAKQDAEYAVMAPQKASTKGAGLTGAEVAALESTAQIDSAVPEHAMKDIAAEYRYYLREGRKTIQASSKRAEQYIDYARKVFREKGMPEELANLAIVESGYRADAVSHAGAAGAWQFMPATGERYGLTQDWWQDERLDPYRATEAAADYLQKLYNDFGDWPTAIAAYNAGEGKISRAKAASGGKDFFEVNAKNDALGEKERLRRETSQYVPRFLAVSKIMRNLPKLGFEEIRPGNAAGILRYSVSPGTDLKELCQFCKIDWKDFVNYNQHHKRNITCTDKNTYIYVPISVREKVASYLCTDKRANYAGWAPAKVAHKGDSLEKISQRANIPLAKLQAANPGLGRLTAGQIILVPKSVNLAAGKPAGKSKGSVAPVTAKTSVTAYVIQPNDTLFSIAKKFNVNVDALMACNSIADPGKVRLGQNLAIPVKNGAKPASTARSSRQTPAVSGRAKPGTGKKKPVYRVQSKDNLWQIAQKNKVSVDDLKRWNKVDEKTLKPGAILVLAGE